MVKGRLKVQVQLFATESSPIISPMPTILPTKSKDQEINVQSSVTIGINRTRELPLCNTFEIPSNYGLHNSVVVT